MLRRMPVSCAVTIAAVHGTMVLDRGLSGRGCHDLAIRTDQARDSILASCGMPGVRTNGQLRGGLGSKELVSRSPESESAKITVPDKVADRSFVTAAGVGKADDV